ncbi:MAG: ABC-2 family transporter protein [Bacilli bacterium]|nr:ABC-2 family transporter protein [Bacilli bacterium]
MKKYLYIYKSELMTNLQYKIDIIFSFIGYFIHIFIFLNLWKYIYSNPEELINGYSMTQMVWYVIITEFLYTILGGRKLAKKISDDVKGGNIAYNINKPYNYILYSLSNHLGSITIKSVFFLVLGLLTGYIFLGSIPNLNILQFLIVLLSCVLATIISTLLIIFIGLFSFHVEDSSPFYWLYSKFILVLGTLFPIEFFPKVVRSIVTYSPIYVVSYGPAKLFVDFNYNKCIPIFISQLIYILISYLLCTIIYKKGVKNLNVNGG